MARRSALAVACGVFACAVTAQALRQEHTVPGVAPQLLSQTGLYLSDGETIDPRNRIFSPQYPLWSDGAAKTRWVQLPPGTTIDATDINRWDFPVGTRFWKEFAFGGRKVETRFLWKVSADRWEFASYLWNADGTDATRAPEDGVMNVAEVAPGKFHSIPSATECRSCHDSARTEILGFDALQLSDDRDPNALHADAPRPDYLTMKTLKNEDRIRTVREVREVREVRGVHDPLTRTVLGYLSANCGSCHNRESSIASLGLDLKARVGESTACSAALLTTIGKRGHWVVPTATDESMIIAPGRPELSALLYRMRSRRPSSQMPAIGTVVVDTKAVALIGEWIAGLKDQDLPRRLGGTEQCR